MIEVKKPDVRKKETTLAPMQGKKRGGGKRIMPMRKELDNIKGSYAKKYNYLCDITADAERYWWINSWLKAYPPSPGAGK